MADKKISKPSGGKLFIMPPPAWTSRKQVVEMAQRLIERAEKGDIQGLAYVAERADGWYESGSTKLDNGYGVGGYLMSMAMRLMGFEENRDRTPV